MKQDCVQWQKNKSKKDLENEADGASNLLAQDNEPATITETS